MSSSPGRWSSPKASVTSLSPVRLPPWRRSVLPTAAQKAASMSASAWQFARQVCHVEVFPDGMAVRIDSSTVHEPDVLVRRGPPLDDDSLVVTDPIILVEVVSPSL